jgi:putative endonuclease
MESIKRKLTSHSLGKRAELCAENFYLKKGFLTLERNYRYGRAEIDLIVRNNNLLVFIEVKARTNKDFGLPENFISKAQQTRILKVAEQYIYLHNWVSNIRFDVIAISVNSHGQYFLEQFEDSFY